jgi:hypothetical protein
MLDKIERVPLWLGGTRWFWILFRRRRHGLDLFFQGIQAPVTRLLAGREILQGHEEAACHSL